MNGKRRIAVLFLLFGTLLVSLVLSAQASASPVSEKARLREVQAKLQVVYRQADTAVEKYDEANSRLSAVTQQITQNAHFLKVTEYNLSIADQELSSRAQNIYKSRDVGVIDVLFSSNSFDDLVTQLDVMQRLGTTTPTRSDLSPPTSKTSKTAASRSTPTRPRRPSWSAHAVRRKNKCSP